MSISKELEQKHQEEISKAIKKLDTSSFIFHKLSPEDTVAKLKTNLKQGLSDEEAQKRIKEYGLNELEQEAETSLWERILEQF
jgi:magnesium-transporting ATPase (P-type)